MNKKQSFDISIKDKFLQGEECLPGIKPSSKLEFGRLINGKVYDTYFSNEFGKTVISSLSNDIYEAYKNGKGNEFDNGKFFSVASSMIISVKGYHL